ncbi:hypothetical protein JQ593_22805 [Bradyrhizobium viridifuturi]|nr:hypothetical protein [Bradyrhizobium viridifuturi]MBR1075927.1 hypothetical protein [Bradyrhizobium viridifuturi]
MTELNFRPMPTPPRRKAYDIRFRCTLNMWDCLNTLDAKAITRAAIERAERNHANEMADLRAKLEG